MLAEHYESQRRVSELLSQPHWDLILGFSQWLDHNGCSSIIVRRHIRTVEHLLNWAFRKGINARELDDNTAMRFSAHLKACRCRGFAHRQAYNPMWGVQLFLWSRRNAGAAPSRTQQFRDSPPALLDEFCTWMLTNRGVTESTLSAYCRHLACWLQAAGDDPRRYKVNVLRHFVTEQHGRRRGRRPSPVSPRCECSFAS